MARSAKEKPDRGVAVAVARVGVREPAETAVPKLVEAYGGPLYAVGLRFCGNREDAEDMVQETFLAAFAHWAQFEGRSKPSTWLYTIAARICQRKRRPRSGQPARMLSLDELLPLREPAIASAPPEDHDALRERRRTREAAENAIAELPEPFRMPFVLKEVLGFAVNDVAAILGLEAVTVRTRVHRARLRVRRALEGGLPRRRVAPLAYSKAVCLDLLKAKQEALDRGAKYRFPAGIVCERCATVFETLDLAQGVCRDLADGKLPARLRREILQKLAARD